MSYSVAPLVLEEVLDPAWLSWALSRNRDIVEIRSIEVIETLGPSATKVRFKPDYAKAPADIPKQLCLKGIFNPALTEYMKSGAQEAEALFYRDCAPKMSVRVPRAIYSESDPATRAGVTIMADLVPEGAAFLTALSPYTPEQALRSVDQLARLHGGSWNAPESQAPWLQSKLDFLHKAQVVAPEKLTELLHGDRGALFPDAVKSGPRLYAALGALAERGRALPSCYIHGDAHAGNVWELNGETGLIDWQLLQRAHWSLDVAYHIAAVLDIEIRRSSEQELLRYYLDRLAAHGGKPPEWDEAWRLYRSATAYGFYLWSITLRVQPEIINMFVSRLGMSAVDHDGLGLLGV